MAAPKSAAGNRKLFVRTAVPTGERVAGFVIVCLLAGIAAVILVKGRHYDPNRFVLRPEALASTAASVEGKAGTVRSQADGRPVQTPAAARLSGAANLEFEYASQTSAAPTGAAREPLDLKVDGVRPMQPTEFYSPENLYEKINGRAPAYLGFNFQELRCRSFLVEGSAGGYVDVFEYRFDTPVNAFGMFALERDPQGAPLDFATDGYAGDMGFFFRQGTHYVQIIASDQEARTLVLARAIAADRAKTLPADDTGLAARRRLPTQGLDPDSVAFVAENALGLAALKNVFQAQYDFGGAKLNFFLMVAAPEEAAAAWQKYQEFVSNLGGQLTLLPDVNGARLLQAETFGAWNVLYQLGGEMGGVFEASDGLKARQFVEQQLQRGNP
ncbi:MAG: hypothetical protein MUE94_10345 [Verrucomicrobia bacterium]|nr:hypothetical protein [Verrucomicrobiota bacterium]